MLRKSKLKLLLPTFAIIFCLGLFFTPFRNVVQKTALSLMGFLHLDLPWSSQSASVELQEQNNLLQTQIKVLSEENKKLELALGFKSATDTEMTPLKLVGEKSLLYNTAYLNNSDNLNLFEGKYIYASQGVVAGYVGSVDGKYVKLDFLGNKEKFIGEVLSTGELLELSGSGIGYYMAAVPKSSSLQIGETIVMKGFPKAIVGIITKIDETDNSLSNVWVRSPINILKTEIFYVAKE